MSAFGNYALCLAWVLSVAGIITGIYSGRTGKRRWFLTSVNCTLFSAACTAISIFILAYLFVNNDYTNQYVWQFSNRDMDTIYKISAIWGGMDGSMLLWAFILSISTALVAAGSLTHSRLLMPWVLAVANSSTLFFLTVVVFATNPFRYIQAPFIPPDGNGLNPLLQNPYMAVHPPMLYLGFTTFAIPFAFCMGALLSGQVTNEWLRLTRRWTLTAWAFLTAGITLGGHWAYIELGWGGFWAWDPVENASFLPWLTGTAYLHSVLVQERKSMLKFWNVWLIVLTYALTVFGTFLTRSGVVQSVHAFASTDVGWIFLVYLGVIIGGAVLLTWYRRVELRSERQIESFVSREAAFLLNNLVFLSICFATFWGVMFPVFSEALTGTKQTIGIPFFNAVNVPLFLLLILLMGIGPLIAWRKASFSSLSRTFMTPFLISIGVGLFIMWGGVTSFYAVVSYSLCFFVLLTILGEVYRAMRVQRAARESTGSTARELQTLFRRHTSKYGGYLVHFGVLIATIGITASMAHKTEQEFSLRRGESYEVGRYRLTLRELREENKSNYAALRATVDVTERSSGAQVTTMLPEMRVYRRNDETTTEVALHMGLREDLYIIVAGVDENGRRAAMKVFINPLQVWLWIGVLIMLGGTGIVMLPRLREPARSTAAEEAPATLR